MEERFSKFEHANLPNLNYRSESEIRKMEKSSQQSGKKHYLFYSCKRRKFFHGSSESGNGNGKTDRRGVRKTSKETRDQGPKL